MFEFTEQHFYKVIWIWPSPLRNLMGAVFRDPEGQWWLRYRWRHFRDAKIFGSEDKRVWYSGKVHAEHVDMAIAGFDQVLNTSRDDARGQVLFHDFEPVIRIVVEGDGMAAANAMHRDAPQHFHKSPSVDRADCMGVEEKKS